MYRRLKNYRENYKTPRNSIGENQDDLGSGDDVLDRAP